MSVVVSFLHVNISLFQDETHFCSEVFKIQVIPLCQILFIIYHLTETLGNRYPTILSSDVPCPVLKTKAENCSALEILFRCILILVFFNDTFLFLAMQKQEVFKQAFIASSLVLRGTTGSDCLKSPGKKNS